MPRSNHWRQLQVLPQTIVLSWSMRKKLNTHKREEDVPYLKFSSKRLSNKTTSHSSYKGKSNTLRCPRAPHVKHSLSSMIFFGRDNSPLKKFEKKPIEGLSNDPFSVRVCECVSLSIWWVISISREYTLKGRARKSLKNKWWKRNRKFTMSLYLSQLSNYDYYDLKTLSQVTRSELEEY